MSSPDILTVCGSAFVAIFVLLTLLAAFMRLLVYLFPVLQVEDPDQAVYAAITSVYQQNYPDLRIAEIKEER